MQTSTGSRPRYQGPRFSIRHEQGQYADPPVVQTTPGGVPTQEYPKFEPSAADAATVPATDRMKAVLDAAYPTAAENPYSEPATAVADLTRPRMVGTPAASPESAYQNPDDLRLNALLNNPAVDTNGRGKSGLYGLLAPIQPNGSNGNMLGQRLAGLINGLLDPSRDEETARQAALGRELQARGIRQADEQAQADLDYRRAMAANQADMPVWRQSEQQRKEAEANQRIEQMQRRIDEMGIYNDARIGQGDRRIDETTRSNIERERDRDLDRESGERIATWANNSRREVASIYASIGAERNAIARDNNTSTRAQREQEFKVKYPGAGLTLTTSDIARRAKEMRILPEEAAKIAVRQGYQIIN